MRGLGYRPLAQGGQIGENMRTYNTVADMHMIAVEQWRKFFAAKTAGEIVAGWSINELWNLAAQEIIDMECNGEHIDDLTPEMESWARDTTDGIEDEIEILELNTPTEPYAEKSIWQQRLESIAVNNLNELAHSMWENEDIEQQQLLLSLVYRIDNGTATDEDWTEILDQMRM